MDENETSQTYLSELRDYIDKIDNEVTMILQSLQWDRNTLLEAKETTVCKYDSNHIMPTETIQKHEEKCSIKSRGYSEEDILLPELFDPSARTLVKFTSDQIKDIIENAAKCDPLFKKGHRDESEPLTLERLQATYTADERRAIHDAVVSTMPSFHDLSDLILPSKKAGTVDKQKSRQQVLAELRDMKRRRTRYRVAVPTRNYSHELRQVIATQMELYTGSLTKVKVEPVEDYHNFKQNQTQKMQKESSHREIYKQRDRYREKESYTRDNRKRDGRYQRDYNMGEKYKKYEDDYVTNRQEKEKHSYHRNRNERESCSSSRNGKRYHDTNERDGYRDRRNYDNSYRYEKQREHSREKKYKDYR